MSRLIFLDTETTGLKPQENRLIEIGCVEVIDRESTGQHYHTYLNPKQPVSAGAFSVHGLSNEFLNDKPLFHDVVHDFLAFIQSAEVIIHNAPFDTGFINMELKRLEKNHKTLEKYCTITDSLAEARKKHRGQKNTLDALCDRYHVNRNERTFHGALLDAQLLSDMYLNMTGGQVSFILDEAQEEPVFTQKNCFNTSEKRQVTPVLYAKETELEQHQAMLSRIETRSGKPSLWTTLHNTQDTQ
ncbi:MAG: DNA polymerase III subunit epsilon [Endozoicomonadaceae bacterium]|nr:DNA polymerase III subunit epsilon [Endozoicomonadaceae bacterium]